MTPPYRGNRMISICKNTTAAADRLRGSPLEIRIAQKPSAKQIIAIHPHSGFSNDQTESHTTARKNGIAPAPIRRSRARDSQNAAENPSCSGRSHMLPQRNSTLQSPQNHPGSPTAENTVSKSSPHRQSRTAFEKVGFISVHLTKTGRQPSPRQIKINPCQTDP